MLSGLLGKDAAKSAAKAQQAGLREGEAKFNAQADRGDGPPQRNCALAASTRSAPEEATGRTGSTYLRSSDRRYARGSTGLPPVCHAPRQNSKWRWQP